MKRSGDVTASAIILFFGSALFLLMVFGAAMASLIRVPEAQPAAPPGGLLVAALAYAALAAWGIATGVGILKLQAWARISVIAMSALAIFGCVCGGIGIAFLPELLKGMPNQQVPPNFAVIMAVISLVVLLIPLGVAIWWLILFTRKRVALEFATRGVAMKTSALFAPAPQQGIAAAHNAAYESGPSQPAVSPAPLSLASASPNALPQPQIPLSIRVVAVIFLIFGIFPLLSFPLVARRNVPTLLLGFMIHGSAAKALLLATAVLGIGFCAAVLWKRAWALDALIAFFIFSVANAAAFALSPLRGAALAEMFAQQSMPATMDPASFQAFQHMMTVLFPFIMLVSVALNLVVLYFLFTRRRAFRAACASSRASV